MAGTHWAEGRRQTVGGAGGNDKLEPASSSFVSILLPVEVLLRLRRKKLATNGTP